MPQVVFHVGAPKTTTSTFQHVLMRNREALAGAGIAVKCHAETGRHPFVLQHLKRQLDPSCELDVSAARENFEESILHGCEQPRIILSEETLSHELLALKNGRGVFGNSDAAAKALYDIMPDSVDPVILLTVRR